MIYWKIINFSASYLTVQTRFQCYFGGQICLLYGRFCYSSSFYLDLPSTWPVCSSIWLFISEVTRHNINTRVPTWRPHLLQNMPVLDFISFQHYSIKLYDERTCPISSRCFTLSLLSVPNQYPTAIKLNFPGTRFWLWNVIDFITYT